MKALRSSPRAGSADTSNGNIRNERSERQELGPHEFVNILTVDVEDWQQSTFDSTLPVSFRVVRNTLQLLDILSACKVKATMFVQGMVAEKYPELVQRIVRDGHEVASHGYSHVPLFKLTPKQFEEDLERSMELLSSLTPERPAGYRAPDFSIRRDTLWALPILRDHGIKYSSSVFPFGGRRYGIPNSNPRPHEILNGLLEVPLTVVRAAGRYWPVAGGGYLRLLAYPITRWALRRVNAEGRPAVIYVHPYELDPQELSAFKARMSRRFYVAQNLNRRHTERKLRSLSRDFSLAPIADALNL